jgi:hypothetical protein
MALTINHSPNQFDFAGNPIAFKVSSDYTSGPYQIVARLFVESQYKSGSYNQVQDNYLDPGSNNAIIFYPGPMLQGYIENTDIANIWNLTTIVKSNTALRRYYVEFYEFYNDTLNNVNTSSTLTAINGKMDPVVFVSHTWLSDLNSNKDYLHEIQSKKIWKTGQQLLYFLNTEAGTNDVDLKATIYYTDSTSEEQTVRTFTGASQYDVLIMPAGYTQLSIGSYNTSKTVYKYELSVWISTTQKGKKVEFILENKPWWAKDFAFLNRFGVFEIFPCTGKYESTINYEKKQGKKHLPYNYTKTQRQSVQRTNSKQKEYTVNTGLMTLEEAEHFEQYDHDLAFVEGKNSWIPIIITSKSINPVNQDEDMHNVELTYKLSHEI